MLATRNSPRFHAPGISLGSPRWIRADQGPVPVTTDELIVTERLHVVVPATQTGQVFYGGRSTEREGDDVVQLQTVAHVAPLDHARGVPGLQGGPQLGRDGSAGVGNGLDVGPTGEEHIEEGVSRHGPGRCHWAGSDTQDVSGLA